MLFFKNYLERLIEANAAADAEAGQSGTSVPGVGDQAVWVRGAGAGDGDSGSLDFAGDLQSSAGDSIAVDESAEWVLAWGYPTVVVTLDGVYSVVASVSAGTSTGIGISLLDGTADDLTWLTDPVDARDGLTCVGAGRATFSATLWLPADTHIDLFQFQAVPSIGGIQLIIQKVG